MKKFITKYPLLIAIIILGFVLRMYKVNTPLLDWHSWRQSDTASVTRQYVKEGIKPLQPTYHDLSNIPSGQDNPDGYRMVEFPLYNIMVAFFLQLVPSADLVTTSRVFSSVFSLGTIISLFFLTRVYFGKKAGYLAAFFYAVIPYSVYYSRVILPEPLFVLMSVVSLTTFKYYLKKDHWGYFVTSLVTLAVAFVLKPFVAFFAPVYIVMLFEERNWKKIIADFRLYLYGMLAVVPFLLWRDWISQYPSGIPASDWLFNGNGIRFRPEWVRWLGYERITKLILGYVGIVFLPISILEQLRNKRFFIPALWLSLGIYFTVIATGNVQHDYYQAIIMPTVAITLGHAVIVADKYLNKKFNALVSMGSIGAVVILMLVFAFYQVRGYYNVNHPEYKIAGDAADRVLPEDAKVIAPQYGGDTAYLFQINRTGWPIGHDINEKIEMGATHYVTTTMDSEAKELMEKYMIIEQTDEYLILDLTTERETE